MDIQQRIDNLDELLGRMQATSERCDKNLLELAHNITELVKFNTKIIVQLKEADMSSAEALVN
jgi:hypothetical protein